MNWSAILISLFALATPALAITLKLYGKINLVPALVPIAPALILTAYLLLYLMVAENVDGIALAMGIYICGCLWVISLPVAWFAMARSFRQLNEEHEGGAAP